MPTKSEIMAKIAPIEDPELGLGLVDLGLIYDVVILDDRIVNVMMTLTTPGCPYGPHLIKAVESAVKELDGVEVRLSPALLPPPGCFPRRNWFGCGHRAG